MYYYLIPILLFAPLLGAFKVEDHVIPRSAPNSYPSEQPGYYGAPYTGSPYMQNTPYGPYYAVPTYSYSERYFDNPNWPNVSPNEVTLTPSGTNYYGPGYGYYGTGRTTTIYNTPYNAQPGYSTQPGSNTYYYGR